MFADMISLITRSLSCAVIDGLHNPEAVKRNKINFLLIIGWLFQSFKVMEFFHLIRPAHDWPTPFLLKNWYKKLYPVFLENDFIVR